jgi:hypothetical protein
VGRQLVVQIPQQRPHLVDQGYWEDVQFGVELAWHHLAEFSFVA